jgi:hypothetical protein
VTWDDLQMVHDADGKKIFQKVQESIHSTTDTMPPKAPLAAAQVKVIDDWIAAGAKKSDATCTSSGAASAPPPSPVEVDAGPPAPPSNPCFTSFQCALGAICSRGTCVPGCLSSIDCPNNAMCFNGQCMTGTNGGVQNSVPNNGACTTSAQCPSSAPFCFQGQCFVLQSTPNGGFCFGSGCF